MTATTGVGFAPATCGELVQGVIGDRNVLITLPVALRARARAVLTSEPGVAIQPDRKQKAAAAVRELLVRHDVGHVGVTVTIESPVPEGKGMASSSADIVASCRAVADLLDLALPEGELGEIACSVEPSDGVMFDRPVAFDFISGVLVEDPGRPVQLLAVVADPGGVVDTVGFQRIPYSNTERQDVQDAYELALWGLRHGDLEAVGRAATASAWINQRRHTKPHLELLVRGTAHAGGLGVCVAHSGTIAAALFTADAHHRAHDLASHLQAQAPGLDLSVLPIGSATATSVTPVG